MTVYQEITHMDKATLAKWIAKLVAGGPENLSAVYCRTTCPLRGSDGHCTIPEDDYAPCLDKSDESIILEWLDREA